MLLWSVRKRWDCPRQRSKTWQLCDKHLECPRQRSKTWQLCDKHLECPRQRSKTWQLCDKQLECPRQRSKTWQLCDNHLECPRQRSKTWSECELDLSASIGIVLDAEVKHSQNVTSMLPWTNRSKQGQIVTLTCSQACGRCVLSSPWKLRLQTAPAAEGKMTCTANTDQSTPYFPTQFVFSRRCTITPAGAYYPG